MTSPRRVVVGLVSLLALAACAASPPLATTAGVDPVTAAHNEAGIAQFNAGRWDAAREHFAAAIQADPRSAASQYNLALALDRLGAHAQARIHFKQAADLEPGNEAITQAAAYRRYAEPAPSGPHGERRVGAGVAEGTSVPYPMNLGR